ncbi:amidohydrolase family protein [Candidatus Rariloculus sp.]|uniref:amidohydrolase family protein n=1 Tax=Candidatus Rariloculus sp. TaxID=3101265 RepID=UPI003D14877B
MQRHKRKSNDRSAVTAPFMLVLAVSVGLAACDPVSEPPSPAAESAVVYEGARLIVGDGSAPIENAVFTVEDGRFVDVGAAGAVAVSADATRVDLSGMTVMPAIVDAHTHMSTTRDALIGDLQRRAYFGVGAAISMGSDGPETPLEIRAELIPDAARFRSAGLGITAPEPGRRAVHWVTTEAEARQAIRDEAARAVDLIKIWVDDRDGQYEQLSPEIYAAIIEEAHANGLRAAAHIFDLEDGKGLLRAGIDVFAHGVRDRDIDEEFLDLVAGRPDVVVIPNLPSRGVPTDLGWLAGTMPDDELQALQATEADPEAQEFFGVQARNLARLSNAGMTIAFGTDGNTPWEPHVEMEDMVAAGMTPADVIVAATRNAADVLGLIDMGTIEPGKSADFVVLEANPLDDITNTRRIASVYLRGDEVDREGLRSRLLN